MLDGIKIYASGNTSKTKQMESFAAMKFDYTLFPYDGLFNNGTKKSRRVNPDCRSEVQHHHSLETLRIRPKKAEKWNAPNKIIIEVRQKLYRGRHIHGASVSFVRSEIH